MPYIFRPTSVKPIPAKATIRTIEGIKYACWANKLGKKVTAELTADGLKCRVESPTWWIEYTDAKGQKDRKKGFRDRGSTMALAAKLEGQARDIRAGIDVPRSESAAHLVDHLPAFRDYLMGKGNSAPHVESVVHNVTHVVTGLSLTTPAAVSCDRIASWLASERKRLGWSAANLNRYSMFLRQFGKWLVRTDRAKANPFEQLASIKTNGAKSRERRRLTDDELQRLISAAATSEVTRRRLTGPDRARLYILAAYTGFRLSTLAKLTPESFVWHDSLPAAVSASGRIVKNKKAHTVPLHPSVAAKLADWLASLPAGKPIFPRGNWIERGYLVVEYDLAVARAAWIAEGRTKTERAKREATDTLKPVNAVGEVFDFHALRVQFISGLALAGVPLSAAQQLADHSTPTLTSNIYTRFGVTEMAEQVAKLPGLAAG